MFEDVDKLSCILIYQGLKSLIDHGEGSGFHNGDMGHPVYLLGASGKRSPDFDYADRPKKNDLFFMLSQLSHRLKKEGVTDHIPWYDFSDWEAFCKYVVKQHKKIRGLENENR